MSLQTPQEVWLTQLREEGSEVSALHTFAYDAVWVAAAALSEMNEAVKRREKFGNQRNTSFSEEERHRMLLEAVKKTQFEGVTVRLLTLLRHLQAVIHVHADLNEPIGLPARSGSSRLSERGENDVDRADPVSRCSGCLR